MRPITISGAVPVTVTDAIVDYTITMPGFVLVHGQVHPVNGAYSLIFDPEALARDFPNLDLFGRDSPGQPGLADTFKIGLLLQGRDASGKPACSGNIIVLQGEQVLVTNRLEPGQHKLHLPVVVKK